MNTNNIKGAKIENNKFCVSVHYRLVDEEVKLEIDNFYVDSLN